MEYLRGAVAAAAASQQVDDIARPPGTGRLGLAGELGPNAGSSLQQQQQQDPVAAAPGPGRDGVTVADYSRPTISTVWSSVLNKGWAGIGISTSAVAPTNPALVTTGTSLLQLCNARLQVWTLNPDTGLNDSPATPAIPMLNFLNATINSNTEEPLTPSGNVSTYFYLDAAAMEVKGAGYAFAFTSAPRTVSDLASQTFNWWLAVMQLSTALTGLENSWTVFRFDPALPAASGASCTAPAKPQLSKIQLTSDYWGIYVTGILSCIQEVGTVRNTIVRGPVIYAMDTADVFGISGNPLTEVAVFSTADLMASLPTGTAVTTASFNQMQPSRAQTGEDAFVEGLTEEVPYVIFVGQNALNPSQLLISRLDNVKDMAAGLTTAANQPTLTTNVVDKGLTGAVFNLNRADGKPQIPLAQPSPGNPLNQGSTFLTTTGAARRSGRLYVARTELNNGINSIFWAIYQVNNGLCSQNLTRRASDVIASNQQMHLAFPSLVVTDSNSTGVGTMHVLYGISKDGTFPPLNGQSPQAFPGVAYTAVKEPETVGGTATVSSVEIKKAGESVQTNGGAQAAGNIIAWSEYSNTELYIDPNDPSIFAIYTAVPYAGPARSSGTAALPNGGTWIGYIPRADMVWEG